MPEVVAVIGYDGIPYAECSRVPLTAIAVPKRLVGQISAELLFERYDGIGSTGLRQILLPPALVIRASSP